LIIDTPPMPAKSVCDLFSGKETVDPLYVPVAVRVIGECIDMFAMFPGRFAVDGVRFSFGLSVGGRGAGPGFMNCPGE